VSLKSAFQPLLCFCKLNADHNASAALLLLCTQCPFCHRVLLTLEAKSIPYKTGLIDFAKKPEW
jgi:glutaredoxin